MPITNRDGPDVTVTVHDRPKRGRAPGIGDIGLALLADRLGQVPGETSPAGLRIRSRRQPWTSSGICWPGQINYASTGRGSSGHPTMELFKSMAGIELVQVPYKVVGQAQDDLMGVEPVGSSPDALARHMRSELAKWARVISQTGVCAD